MRRMAVMTGVLVLLGLSGAALARAEAPPPERRDPFVDPRTIVIPQEVKPRLMGVLEDPEQPLAIIGEVVATVGDTIDGWNVIAISSDGITVQYLDRREDVHVGDLLPSP